MSASFFSPAVALSFLISDFQTGQSKHYLVPLKWCHLFSPFKWNLHIILSSFKIGRNFWKIAFHGVFLLKFAKAANIVIKILQIIFAEIHDAGRPKSPPWHRRVRSFTWADRPIITQYLDMSTPAADLIQKKGLWNHYQSWTSSSNSFYLPTLK